MLVRPAEVSCTSKNCQHGQLWFAIRLKKKMIQYQNDQKLPIKGRLMSIPLPNHLQSICFGVTFFKKVCFKWPKWVHIRYIYIYICIYMNVIMCVCVCLCVCVYVCMYVCMFTKIWWTAGRQMVKIGTNVHWLSGSTTKRGF